MAVYKNEERGTYFVLFITLIGQVKGKEKRKKDLRRKKRLQI